MNQSFLAIVVKILAAPFTIPTTFADLLRRTRGRSVRLCDRLPEFSCVGVQSIHAAFIWFSLAILTTIAAGGTALAGPLPLNPDNYSNGPRPPARGAARRAPSQQQGAGAAFAAQPMTSRQRRCSQAAARNYGGGFFEVLFCGPGGATSRPSEPPVYYRGAVVPSDLGPGMIEVVR